MTMKRKNRCKVVETKPAPIGARKTAREAMGLDSKDAAAQLRLNESIILMMEKDQPDNLPMTAVRGYIRARQDYYNLIMRIKQAIEPIKPNLAVQSRLHRP